MSWNRNDPGRKPAASKKPSAWRGVAAGGLVVIIGLLAWWLFSSSVAKNEGQDSERDRRIKEVKPAISPKTNEVVKVEPKKVDPNARPTKVGEIVNGYMMAPSGRIFSLKGCTTNSIADRAKGPWAIFDHDCENEIACYLSIKPGTPIIGTPNYNGRFTREFLESLKTPIIPTKDDTPEQAELKRAVNQTKIDLKAAYDRGEDIEQIMLDTRKELQDMMMYKNELQQQFNDMRKKCETEQEVEDLLDACNQMLEKKGIAPMKFGPIMRRKLMSTKKEN